MTRIGRSLFALLAVGTGLVFQPQATRMPVSPAGETGCPPNVALLQVRADHADARTEMVTCAGWNRGDFFAGTGPADILIQPRTPHVGDPCREVHYYRAALVEESSGLSASFPFAGGMSTGTVPLTAVQVSVTTAADAYVTDVQLGSVEPADRDGVLTCTLNPTYHFLCPGTDALDQFCVTWLHRSRVGVPG